MPVEAGVNAFLRPFKEPISRYGEILHLGRVSLLFTHSWACNVKVSPKFILYQQWLHDEVALFCKQNSWFATKYLEQIHLLWSHQTDQFQISQDKGIKRSCPLIENRASMQKMAMLYTAMSSTGLILTNSFCPYCLIIDENEEPKRIKNKPDVAFEAARRWGEITPLLHKTKWLKKNQ